MTNKLRRLRRSPIIRDMIAETKLSLDMFIYPYFVKKGKAIRSPIAAMPGVFHFSPDELVRDVEVLAKQGINKLLLFGVDEPKSENAESAYDDKGIVPTTLRRLRAEFGNDIYLISDVCVCAYTTHGHCGVLSGGQILNKPSVDLLCQMSLAHAHAGADMVAPSDMMDGRIAAIRHSLDQHGFLDTGILSYAVKFASSYYGPFREAAHSSPQSGDRKGYQMDFRNPREALREALIDQDEGADMLMVKPALAYLDIIRSVRENTHLPLACYNVSGEYSMLKIAAAHQLINEQQMVMENMYAFARAGADIIISYHVRDIVQNKWLP